MNHFCIQFIFLIAHDPALGVIVAPLCVDCGKFRPCYASEVDYLARTGS